jgi:hypothetical protein
MTPRRLALPLAGMLVLLASAVCGAQQADPPAEKPKQDKEAEFLRITREEDESPIAMEVAVVTLAKAGGDGPKVDLVSAVHVGEKGYYNELNRRFKDDYDVVLYELVAPEGTTVPKGGVGRSTHPISILQNFMTGMLELEFQLNAIDYTQPNFVHADMSPKQMSESMKARGESVFQTFFRMMGYAMSQQGDPNSGDTALFVALLSKNRALAMKRVLAEQFQDLEGSLNAISGPDGSTLITERNKVALEVLKKQIEAGHKRLAIFYGAGHMYDFRERIEKDFGLEPVKTEWLVAWDLKGKSPAKSPRAKKKPDQTEAVEKSEPAPVQ